MTISLGFVFGLAVFALMYQTYLSVLIFRVLCDVTVRYVNNNNSLYCVELTYLGYLLVNDLSKTCFSSCKMYPLMTEEIQTNFG